MASYIVEKDRLSGEYADVFARVESYAMLENINADKQEEMLSNLVDLLYTAQTENKPAARIVGADVEKFCKEYFQEQIGWKGRLREIPSLFYRLAWVVLVISLLELFFSESSDGETGGCKLRVFWNYPWCGIHLYNDIYRKGTPV